MFISTAFDRGASPPFSPQIPWQVGYRSAKTTPAKRATSFWRRKDEIQNKTQELANKREQEVQKDKATQNLQAPRRIETKEQIDELVKKLEALKENLPVNVNW